jgi:transposase
MPRKRDQSAPRVVYRTARSGLRVTRRQRERVFGLLRSAGDVWCCVLELNAWRRRRQDMPLAGYQELCRELSASGPGTFGELDAVGARSVLRRYSDAWFATAGRRGNGDVTARYPRRERGLVPVRWYRGTFRLDGRVLAVPVARGRPPLAIRLDRDIPYPAGQVRSVTLGYDAGRLYVDVTAEVPVARYPGGQGPDPARAAGIDLGIIHPYAVAGPEGQGCWCPGGRSGRSAGSTCATARAAPGPPPPARRSRGSETGHHLGRGEPDRHPGRRRPARRPEPEGRPEA